MTLNREHVRRLAADLVTPQMDQLFAAAADAGAPWGKPCGAGGGGCLLFLCRPGARGAVVASLESTGVRVIPVRFAPRSEW
jgi:D-glycero-alpha-D-manno-heptose-7-phosphate kinase